jgi:glyoxylase I family protein
VLWVRQATGAGFGHHGAITWRADRRGGRHAGEGGNTMPTVTGAHHVALTVQNVDASEAWYQDLFGMQPLLQTDDETVRVRVLVHPDSGLIIGLREYAGHDDGAFSEFRTGLDHIAFAVSSRDELEAWQDRLAEKGITFSPIAESPIGTLVVLRDPDNIQLELWLPLGE